MCVCMSACVCVCVCRVYVCITLFSGLSGLLTSHYSFQQLVEQYEKEISRIPDLIKVRTSQPRIHTLPSLVSIHFPVSYRSRIHNFPAPYHTLPSLVSIYFPASYPYTSQPRIHTLPSLVSIHFAVSYPYTSQYRMQLTHRIPALSM